MPDQKDFIAHPGTSISIPGVRWIAPSSHTVTATMREAEIVSTQLAPPVQLFCATSKVTPQSSSAANRHQVKRRIAYLHQHQGFRMSHALSFHLLADNWPIHARLARFNLSRLKPGYIRADWRAAMIKDHAMQLEEGEFVETERARVSDIAATAPQEASAFVQWFEKLRKEGPGQGDPLFDWLASHSTLADMRWFVAQEAAGEAGFEDLVAMAQVKLEGRPKLEMARNYWDEMGRGNARGMHGPMLSRLVERLALKCVIEGTVWEALALSNLMIALAANRRYAYQAIGALGVIEMTAPERVARVNEGLKRLGLPAATRRYFQLHATLDIEHSKAWNQEVLHPLVGADPRSARPLAEGALMRLQSGARCFERYREQFGMTN